MKTSNAIALAVVLALIGGAIWYLEAQKPDRGAYVPRGENEVAHDPAVETSDYATRVKTFPFAQELVHPDGYLNTSASTTIGALVGKKIVLVDFWTYSCINCQRTNPYLNAWYTKYRDYGLEIIGVHAPEFAFEKEKANVAAAIKKFGIEYPVVQDNELATWDAYRNQYWPHKYLIDINGLVVYDHIGEGGYEETEDEIRVLLAERMKVLGDARTLPDGYVTPGETIAANSPETYFGWSRNQYLGNGDQRMPGVQELSLPSVSAKNTLYLGGTWNFEKEFAASKSPASIVYTYDAKRVYIVAHAATPVRLRVLRDGVPITGEKGSDVDANGYVTVSDARLYTLVNESVRGVHTLTLLVEGAGLEAFTFTFG